MGYQETLPRSSIRRIIGIPKDAEKEYLKDFAQKFKYQDFLYFDMGIKELEKTPEKIKIIRYAGELAKDVSKKYGGPGLGITEKNIHILNEKDFEKFAPTGYGYYDSFLQAVFLKGDFPLLNFPSELMLRTLETDILFESYQAGRYFKHTGITKYLRHGGKLTLSQDGIHVKGKNKKTKIDYFENLNKAVCQELARRTFNAEILNKEVLKRKNPEVFELLKVEIGEVEYMRQKVRKEERNEIAQAKVVADMFKQSDKTVIIPQGVNIRTFGYREERDVLNNLIEKVYLKNRDTDEFKNKNEKEAKDKIFGWFASSVFTGKLLWGHKINQSFGVPTFQGMGKADKDIKELGKFVGGLKV